MIPPFPPTTRMLTTIITISATIKMVVKSLTEVKIFDAITFFLDGGSFRSQF